MPNPLIGGERCTWPILPYCKNCKGQTLINIIFPITNRKITLLSMDTRMRQTPMIDFIGPNVILRLILQCTCTECSRKVFWGLSFMSLLQGLWEMSHSPYEREECRASTLPIPFFHWPSLTLNFWPNFLAFTGIFYSNYLPNHYHSRTAKQTAAKRRVNKQENWSNERTALVNMSHMCGTTTWLPLKSMDLSNLQAKVTVFRKSGIKWTV